MHRISRLLLAGVTLLAGVMAVSGLARQAPVAAEDEPEIDALTAGQLWRYAKSLDFEEGPSEKRDCQGEGTQDCNGRVEAREGAEPDSGTVNTKGRVVGLVMNEGKHIPFWWNSDRGPDMKYGLSFSRTNNVRYYLVEYNLQGTADPESWRWKILEAVQGSDSAPRMVMDGPWIACQQHQTQPAPNGEKARFAKCQSAHREGLVTTSMLDHHEPAWLTCTGGCCTAGS